MQAVVTNLCKNANKDIYDERDLGDYFDEATQIEDELRMLQQECVFALQGLITFNLRQIFQIFQYIQKLQLNLDKKRELGQTNRKYVESVPRTKQSEFTSNSPQEDEVKPAVNSLISMENSAKNGVSADPGLNQKSSVSERPSEDRAARGLPMPRKSTDSTAEQRRNSDMVWPGVSALMGHAADPRRNTVNPLLDRASSGSFSNPSRHADTAPPAARRASWEKARTTTSILETAWTGVSALMCKVALPRRNTIASLPDTDEAESVCRASPKKSLVDQLFSNSVEF